MKKSRHLATISICIFFILYFVIAFSRQRDFPVLVVAGEESPGTWMSGTLLIISATVSLIMTTRLGGWPWSLLFVFFVVLALDERFMFHEQMKASIIFAHGKSASPLFYELPVIVGACLGLIVSFTLLRCFDSISRILLVCGVILGLLSVAFDVLNDRIFFEECFKLLAELFVTCSLLRKAEMSNASFA